MEAKREKYWEKVGEAEREKLRAREEREKVEAAAKAEDVAHTQQLQLEDFKKRYVEGLMAEKAEGERVLAQAAVALEEEKAKARRVRERAIADAKGACFALAGAAAASAAARARGAARLTRRAQLCCARTRR